MSVCNHPGLLEIKLQSSEIKRHDPYEQTLFIRKEDVLSISVIKASHVDYGDAGTLIHTVEISILDSAKVWHGLRREYANEANAKSAYLTAKSDVESLFTSTAEHDILTL